MNRTETMMIDDVIYVRADSVKGSAPELDGMTHAIIRTYSAGVFAGYVQEKKGKEIRAAYIEAIPGLDKFLEAVRKASERGYVRGLDHRRILVDSRHKSLNYLIQGSSAIIAKRWMVLVNERLPEHTHQLAFIHDELQFETEEEKVNDLKFTLELSAAEAGEYYNLRTPIAADSKSGRTWSEVH